MVLANRTRVQNSRTLLRAFGGLNEGYGCSEAEYSAGWPTAKRRWWVLVRKF